MNVADLKISVALASYNGERFIGEQLRSFVTQTVPPFEVVVCDDGSTDGTLDIIQAFSRKHPGLIRLYSNPVRLGVNKNFERAISLSSGDYIFLSDQDDVWLPNKIELMTRLMVEDGRPCGAFCNSMIVDERLNRLNMTHWLNRGFARSELETAHDIFKLFQKRVPAAGHDMAFSSELREILLPFPDLPECHDSWVGMVLASLSLWHFTGEALTLFRQHRNNTSGSGKKKNLRRKLDEARWSIENNTFAWNEALFQELIERLKSRAPKEIIAALNDRREHSATRADMNVSLIRRLPMIFREIRNRRYFRYGRGWQNVIQDLFLR